jgi:predicted site-specific integrase-resolvase
MRELYPKAEIVEEVGGGLNFKRKGLLTLLERAMQGEQLTLVVAHRDRLARFGFNLIEFVIRNSGGKVVVLDESVGSPERELTEDLLAILHHFSCRMHGSRSRKQNKEGSHLPDQGAETSVQEMVRSFKAGLQQHCGVTEPNNEAETLDGCG